MRSTRVCLLVSALLVLLVWSPIKLQGQTASTGAVTGTVTDPGGGTVAGAPVTLQNLATSAQLNMITDSSGHYMFPSVAPGQYSLKVVAKGFRSSIISPIAVNVSKSNTVDVNMELGESTQHAPAFGMATTGTSPKTSPG